MGGGGLTIGGLAIGGESFADSTGGALIFAPVGAGFAPESPASVVLVVSGCASGSPASGRLAASPLSSEIAVIVGVGPFGPTGFIGGAGIGGGERSHPRSSSAAPNAARVTSAGDRGRARSATVALSGAFARFERGFREGIGRDCSCVSHAKGALLL